MEIELTKLKQAQAEQNDDDPNSFASELVSFLTQVKPDELVINNISIFCEMFTDTLNDSFIILDVIIVAMKAMVDFIIQCSMEMIRFQNLLPVMMKILTETLMDKELEVYAQSELKILIDLAKNEPRFFRTEVVDVINSMFEIIESEFYENKTKHLAVEFMVSLAEAAKVKALGMMKKYPLFTYKCCAVLFNLLGNVDQPGDDDDDYLDQIFGKKCLIRLCNALGGKFIVSVAFENLEACLAEDDNSWQELYAALAQIDRACLQVTIKHMMQMVTMVLDCVEYPHPSVRIAALGAIEQFSLVLRPYIQEQCHGQLLPALIKAMDDSNALVQGIAMRTAWIFYEFGIGEHLISYVDEIFDKLRELLSQGLKHKGDAEIQEYSIQDSAVLLLSVTSSMFKERFLYYFESFRPYYKTVATRALEMMILDSAYGDEKSGNDVEQVMKALITLQRPGEEDINVTIIQLKRFESLCKHLGPRFLPYMSIVIPFCFQYAQLVPDVTILSADSGIISYLGDDGIRKSKLGTKQ